MTDKVYVKSGVYEVVGYDLAKGTKLLSIPLEGQVTRISADDDEEEMAATALLVFGE
ncbi:hypothetical protein [Streptomyces sp. gb1(2016)]|uniref:hypothetical protein n=1 Tax=Streptomyces sp. gb1(2016) TaxID=1828321 RepID=UPI003966D092